MTREKEIKEARHEWYLRTQDADFCAGFQKGAEWADRTMIDKACEWLHSTLYLDYERSIEHRFASLEDLINDFRKDMKGD